MCLQCALYSNYEPYKTYLLPMQAVMTDKLLFLSGQIGMAPKTTELVDGGVKEQARQALVNMGEVLR